MGGWRGEAERAAWDGTRCAVWTRRWLSLWLLLAAVGHCQAAAAPVIDATSFGHAVELTGCWVAAAGDDPAREELGFNDSGWVLFRSGDTSRRLDLEGTKTLWLRCHVQLRPGGVPSMDLFVENINADYGVYVNGVKLGQNGEMPGVDSGLPQGAFEVPAKVLRAAPGGQMVVAMRFAAGPVGFAAAPPYDKDSSIWLSGPEETVLRGNELVAHEWGAPLAIAGFYLLVGVCGLVIWWSLRGQREYLALAVWTLSAAEALVLNFVAWQHQAPQSGGLRMLQVLFAMSAGVAELEFMRLLLQQRRGRLWWALELATVLAWTMVPLVNLGAVPLTLAVVAYYVPAGVNVLVVGWLLVRGARAGNRDAPFMLLPICLWSLNAIARAVGALLFFWTKQPTPPLPGVHWFGYVVPANAIADTVGLLCLVLIILMRTIRLSEEKADLAAEVAAAEELQMLLLARASRPTPGYVVETVYRPMQQVGGDFFLVQPCAEDGSLVAILGDVSGKGLQAAMRVAMILGVLQQEAMGEPERVLQRLNRALVAQNEFGFTTACCVRLEADGRFCFANAGHLNPYVGERELVSEGALPLGMDAEASYAVECGQLARGERMVLLSDGVAEARNKAGELFGFERVCGVAGWKAEEIAAAAQRFGQEDDITVLAVRVM